MSVVIPIQTEAACTALRRYLVVDPHFEGTPERVRDVVQALEPLVKSELGADLPCGAWLRCLKVVDGEAVLTIAPDLACHGHVVATLAFDVMRRLLPDTDIYVGAAPV